MMRETYEKDLANQNFEKYINKIYSYNLAYFLNKSTMESESEKLIKNSVKLLEFLLLKTVFAF